MIKVPPFQSILPVIFLVFHNQFIPVNLKHERYKEKYKIMFLFQAPPPTRFDLCFSVAGFPIRVHPLFWLMTILFGASSGSPAKLLGLVIAVFVSITIHELGHAFALRRYGQESQIILHLTGGADRTRIRHRGAEGMQACRFLQISKSLSHWLVPLPGFYLPLSFWLSPFRWAA